MPKLRKPGLSKRKGLRPSKREQAQMLALKDLNMSNYQVGEIMGRSPHTIKRYCESPMFTDPKFQKLVEEYKSKELIDLTAMNISARARIHDLIPTMTPIEAIATMDKSFQQRRLIEGKSTENIFSLRKIIEEAHSFTHTEAPDAVQVESGSPLHVRGEARSGEGDGVEDAQYQEAPAACEKKEKETIS